MFKGRNNAVPSSAEGDDTVTVAATSELDDSQGEFFPFSEDNHDPQPSSNAELAVPSRDPGVCRVVKPYQLHKVHIPINVEPGMNFKANVGSSRTTIQLCCPPKERTMVIAMPSETKQLYVPLRPAPLTADTTGGGAVEREVAFEYRHPLPPGCRIVSVPPNVPPGTPFYIRESGQLLAVKYCQQPNNEIPKVLRIQLPPQPQIEKRNPYLFHLPPEAQSGLPFIWKYPDGRRSIKAICPPKAGPSQKIRVDIPPLYADMTKGWCVKETSGWEPMLRLTDFKFQWTNAKQQEVPITINDVFQKAFCRKLTMLPANDIRMCSGAIRMESPKEVPLDMQLVQHGRPYVSCTDILQTRPKSFHEKQEWLQEVSRKLWTDESHVYFNIRKSHIVEDGVDSIMSLSQEDMRKKWEYNFLDETEQTSTADLTDLLLGELFTPHFGLWEMTDTTRSCLTIDADSDAKLPDEYLVYYRVAGRVLGRALLYGKRLPRRLSRVLCKQLLGWPIVLDDIRSQNQNLYQSLKELVQIDDVLMLCLDFTVSEEKLGRRVEIELVEGGTEKEVTNENLPEFLEATIKHHLFERTLPQLTELTLGFLDTIPEPLLAVFDVSDLERGLFGLPATVIEEWKQHTVYRGLFEEDGDSHPVVRWFWEVVKEDFDDDMRSELLRFWTGVDYGLPLDRHFEHIETMNQRNFRIHGVSVDTTRYPRSHTSFNRLDLPTFKTKKELCDKLNLSISTMDVGFDIE